MTSFLKPSQSFEWLGQNCNLNAKYLSFGLQKLVAVLGHSQAKA